MHLRGELRPLLFNEKFHECTPIEVHDRHSATGADR
jgi:hypothetical protein